MWTVVVKVFVHFKQSLQYRKREEISVCLGEEWPQPGRTKTMAYCCPQRYDAKVLVDDVVRIISLYLTLLSHRLNSP